MKRAVFGVVLGLLLYIGYRTVKNENLDLKYFKSAEFGVWWPLMSRDLLLKLDKFREKWGAPVVISSHPKALGREDESGSMHNILKWGEVRAVDIFPRGMDTLADRQRAFNIARSVGFNGVGVYTDTLPYNMLHLDNREVPVHWSRVDGVYKYNRIV